MSKRIVATSIESQAARAAADAFAESVGEDKHKIRVVDPQWRELLSACCRVEPHVTRWRAETTLTLADLGIEPKDAAERKALDSTLSLGSRYLLPRNVIEDGQRLENRFRNALWKRSLPSHWGNLVPQQQYAAWRDEATNVVKDYLTWAQDVYDCWPELMMRVEEDYRQLGLQAWNRLVQSGRDMPPMNEWVARFVQRCMAKVETREYWLAKAKMWWDVSYIPLKSMLAEDEAEAAHVAAVAQAKTEMERDILNSAKKQFETGLFQFMADVRGEITERIFNVLVDVLTAMERNGRAMPRNSSKQLKNLLEAVEDLKFWDDPKLDEQMAAIRSIMNQRSDDRDYSELQDVMRQIGAEARLLLNELGRPVQRRSRQVGIPETEQGLGTLLRQQRRSLDVSDEVMTQPITRQARKLEAMVA